MADPIARAINTFSALKGMEYQGQQARRLERLDGERAADRTFTRELSLKADARAQEQFEISKADHEVNKARTNLEWGRKVDKWGEEDLAEVRKKADQTYLEFTNEMKAIGKTDWGPAEVAELLRRQEPNTKGLRHEKLRDLYDPEKVAERKQATLEILQQLKSGNFEPDSILRNANTAFAPELAARGQKYGAKEVRFSRLVPSPQGDGFMAELEITKADGTTYRAPATMNGGTLDDGDNQVKNFRMEEVVPYLVGQLVTFEGAQSYLKTRGLLKKEERKLSEVGSDKAGRQLIDMSTGEVVRTISGPIGDEDGVTAGRKGGKTDLVELKTGRFITVSDAKNAYMATYGKSDGMGGFVVDEGKSAPTFEEWINSQAKAPVFVADKRNDPKLVAKAEEMADAWVKEQGKFFSSDAADFAGYGGNREQARAAKMKEFYAMLAGEEAVGAGGQPVGAAAPPVLTQAAIDQVSPERLSLLQQGLKNAEAAGKEWAIGYLKELNEQQPAEFAALTRTLEPSGAAPQSRGMAGPAAAPVRDQIYTNLNRSMQQGGWNSDYPVELVGKGLSALWQIAPARLAAAGVADALQGFQQWAQSRYQSPDAAKSSQALAEYAKENPQAAEQIAKAALQAAQ